MKDIWDKQSNLVDKVNTLWQDVRNTWSHLEAGRNEAGIALQEILDNVIEAATKSYSSSDIRVVPIVELGLMTGVRVWVGTNCHIYKTKEVLSALHSIQVSIGQENKLDRGEEESHLDDNNHKPRQNAKSRGR